MKRPLAARTEGFDSYWQAPEDVERGYTFLEHSGFRDVRVFPLRLYVFFTKRVEAVCTRPS